jgi:phosphate transport system permease protein
MTPPPPAEAAVAGTAVGRAFDQDKATKRLELGFKAILIGSIAIALGTLAILLVDIVVDGLPQLSPSFLTDLPSRIDPASSGIGPAIAGTLWLMAVCAAFIIPVGIATAIYLEEYANRERWHNRFIEVNIQNLAAVPSIVYGILGLAFLVRGPIGMGRILIAGGLTLGLLVLPVVIVAAREAIRAVPPSIREGSLALGATKWQTIRKQTLPAALPGIATGTILALSRAIGETAPLIVIGASAFATFTPNAPTDAVTALPIQIFQWISESQDEYKLQAATAIMVLMAILLAMNGVAIWLRNKYEQKW